MAKLELTLTHNEVEAIVREWVGDRYSSLKFESMTTLTGVNVKTCIEFGNESIPVFKGFKIKVEEKESVKL